MIGKRVIRTGMVCAVLAAGPLFAVSGVASASTPSPKFLAAQKQLEDQLAGRVTQLGRLGSDVTGSKTLTPGHLATLDTNISGATANINALVIKVPGDTTWAELNTDRKSMLSQNRVYAVLTPQVFQTIEADSIGAQVLTFEANEATLQTEVNSLVGQPGYKTASNHYLDFVRSVNKADENSSNVAAAVLAQVPADYPGDTHVFVHANHELLNADLALAYASYDESVIGLAAGGYTGA